MAPPRSAVVTVLVAAIFLLIALSPQIYPLTVHVPQSLRGIAEAVRPALDPLAGTMRNLLSDPGWTPSELVRKAYSILAFAVLGFIVAYRLRHRSFNRRLLATSALIAAFSTIIEIAQRQAPNHESWLSSLIDIACGALGGAAGVVAQGLFNLRRARS